MGFAELSALVALRKADNSDGTVLVYTEYEWEAFVGGAKNGEFDIDGQRLRPRAEVA